jgi:F-type H+-transporting ATPase subunit alpha
VRLALAQYRALAAFAQFASDLDAASKRQLDRGVRVTELMKQKQYSPLTVAEMALSLCAVNEGFLDDVPVEKVVEFETELHAHAHANSKALLDKLDKSGDYDDTVAAEIKKAVETFKSTSAFASAAKDEPKGDAKAEAKAAKPEAKDAKGKAKA